MEKNPQHRPPGAGKSSFDLIDPEKVFSQLKQGSAFLDIGCGRGDYSLFASSIIGADGLVFAIDLWEEGISVLKKQIQARGIKNIRPMIADAGLKIPLADHSIDFCLMATVLHDLAEAKTAQGALRETRRVLIKEGQLAIIEFKKIEGPPGPPLHIRLSPEEVERMVIPFGFRKESVTEVGLYNYLMIFSAVKIDE